MVSDGEYGKYLPHPWHIVQCLRSLSTKKKIPFTLLYLYINVLENQNTLSTGCLS